MENIGAYGMSLGRYVFSGGNVALGRTDTGEPITGRDLIALLATIGIDLGLLALAIVNPPPKQLPIRFGGDQARQIARRHRHRHVSVPRRRSPLAAGGTSSIIEMHRISSFPISTRRQRERGRGRQERWR